MTFPRRGRYTGRLAIDPDTGFHIDPKGRKVVTLDGGLTWRYARRSDTSHRARYEEDIKVVDSTANEHARRVVAHGPLRANELVSPHHFEVQPGDAHYNAWAPNKTRTRLHPDAVAPMVTSHTDAWKETA